MVEVIGKAFILIGVLMLAGEFALPGFFMGAVGIAIIVAGVLIELGINSPEWIAFASVVAGAVSLAFFYFLGRWLTGRRKISVGAESIVGETGKVVNITEEGRCVVKIKGEEWSAHFQGEMKKGDKVKVIKLEGVHLKIERI